jgi:hypothetical protein
VCRSFTIFSLRPAAFAHASNGFVHIRAIASDSSPSVFRTPRSVSSVSDSSTEFFFVFHAAPGIRWSSGALGPDTYKRP